MIIFELVLFGGIAGVFFAMIAMFSSPHSRLLAALALMCVAIVFGVHLANSVLGGTGV